VAGADIGDELVQQIALIGDALGAESQKWWCGSQIGSSGSNVASRVGASQSFPP